MRSDPDDFPLSIALVIAAVVVGGFLYLRSFGHDPSVLKALASTIEVHHEFWMFAAISASANLALIGSWVRRTVGLKKQGSRLQKLDGKSLKLFYEGDRYALGVMAVTFLSVKGLCREPLSEIYGVIGQQTQTWAEIALVGNFVILTACLWLLAVRLAPRFQPKPAPELSEPIYQPMTLVLGTTPMEVAHE